MNSSGKCYKKQVQEYEVLTETLLKDLQVPSKQLGWYAVKTDSGYNFLTEESFNLLYTKINDFLCYSIIPTTFSYIDDVVTVYEHDPRFAPLQITDHMSKEQFNQLFLTQVD